MTYELRQEGLMVQTQLGIPMQYETIQLDIGFRLDILVDNKVIIEVKSTDSLADVHFKQLLTYLKLSGKKLGLLINFNVSKLEDKVSMVRIANF